MKNEKFQVAFLVLFDMPGIQKSKPQFWKRETSEPRPFLSINYEIEDSKIFVKITSVNLNSYPLFVDNTSIIERIVTWENHFLASE